MQERPPIVVIAPDSFKGSIPASDAASAIAEGLRRVWPGADLRLCPMADGGEGTLDAALSCGGQRFTARVAGASGKTVEASYGIVGEQIIGAAGVMIPWPGLGIAWVTMSADATRYGLWFTRRILTRVSSHW